MPNLFRSVLLVSFVGIFYFFYSSDAKSLNRRAPTNFITQCSNLVPNMVALTVLTPGPHLDDWLAALAVRQTSITFMLDRASLADSNLVKKIHNGGHNIGMDARNEKLTADTIKSTLAEMAKPVGPVIGKTPRFYCFNENGASLEQSDALVGIALNTATPKYPVRINTDFLKSGDIAYQVANVVLTGSQTILGIVDNKESDISTTQFANFLATLGNSNRISSLVDCTAKQSAYDMYYANAVVDKKESGSDPTVKNGEKSSGEMLKWFSF